MALLNFSRATSDEALFALQALLATAAAWYLVSAVRSWHRLRHFPGPPLASVSYLWLYRTMRRGYTHKTLAGEQARHGAVVRIGPNELLVADAGALWAINGLRSGWARGDWYASIKFDPYGHSVLSQPDTALHDRAKSRLVPAYAGRGGGSLDLEREVDAQLEVLVGVLRDRYAAPHQRPLDLSRVVRLFQVDLLTRVAAGRPWGSLADEKDHFDFLSVTDVFVPFLHSFAMIPMLRDLFASKLFLKLAGPKATDAKGMGRFLGYIKESVEQRFKGETKADPAHGDMIDEFRRQGLSQRECELEISIQMPAGADTTTVAIRGILLYLMTTPHAYHRLKQEIAEGVKAGRVSSPITNAEARQLPYLQAVIYEGLRILPPGIVGFPKRVPRGGGTVCGRFVPGGTDVFMNFVSTLRDPEVFKPDPDVFRPERFLDCDGAAELRRHVDLGFGFGRWLCPGRTLAMLELNKIFVELLRRFDFQVVNPDSPWKCRGYTSFQISEFWVRVQEGAVG